MKETVQTSAGKADWRDNVTWYTHETRLARFVKRFGGAFFRWITDVESTGQENVPTDGPCILASNHINNLDVIYLGLSSPRHPHFMAKIELYKNPVVGRAIRLAGAFPVYRGERDAWALKQAGRVLEAGQALCMFPEGTRSGRKAQLKRGKLGVVKLALEHRAPVVPIAILGTQNFRFGLGHRNKIRIQFGEPLDVAALVDSPPHHYDTLRELTTLVMQRIAAMLPPEHRGMYGD